MYHYTQDNRPAAVSTPLGKDKLLLRRMVGRETISKPFNYVIEMLSEYDDIKFNKLLGKKVTIRLDHTGKKQRFFNGLVADFRESNPKYGFHCYYAQVVPWFWFLKESSSCRIFRHKTIPEILLSVFKAHGFKDFETSLSVDYPTLEHCVQYRETDFIFASRLMEEVGIYYFFNHEKDKHIMVLADSKSSRKPCPDFDTIRYINQGRGNHVTVPNGISHWEHRKHVVPGAFEMTDFNFAKPLKKFASEVTDNKKHYNADFEQYVYDNDYIEDSGNEPASASGAEDLAKMRLAALQADHDVAYAESHCRGLKVGHTFKLTDCFHEGQNGDYFITSVHHQIEVADYSCINSAFSGASKLYSCSISMIPDKVEYRPACLTPKPLISGPQTAIVVGKKDEEVETDQYGRVKVHFHWDRDKDRDLAEDEVGKRPEHRSCWVRVSQNWAGKKWGTFFLPRIGQEVIVDFLEGNPDRPIIIGSVYNGDHMPPYKLPAHKTMSTIKSHSSKGGLGFNEMRFEDKKGSEEVYIHAQKDQNNIVENDETTGVGNDRTENVGNNETITIGNDRAESVGNNETITIGSNRTESVGSNETITVALARTRLVGVNESVNVGAAQEITVGGAQAVTVGAARAVTVGANQAVNIGKDQSTSVGKNDSLNVGKQLTINAGDQILIKTGEASILMKKDGTIQIKGKDITVKGSGKINVKASKDVVIKGKKILGN